MIIDAHAHIFPDKIAEKASAGISGFIHLPAGDRGEMNFRDFPANYQPNVVIQPTFNSTQGGVIL